MAAAIHPLRHADSGKNVDRVIEDRGHEADSEEIKLRDSEVKDADADARNGSVGTPTHPTLEHMDSAQSVHKTDAAAAVERARASLHNSPIKKPSEKSLTRKLTQQQLYGSSPNSPKRDAKEKSGTPTKGTPTPGTPIKKPLLPTTVPKMQLRDMYKRTASSEEEELHEILEQQRMTKEKVKKPDLVEKKKTEKKKDKKEGKEGKDKEEEKEKERKRKEKERKKKKREHEQQKNTVTRDSYQNDSRRDAKLKTKVCAVM